MDIWTSWTVHLVMVLFGHGRIWTWCYLDLTKNVQKKINPSRHVQIHPVCPIDIPNQTWGQVVKSKLITFVDHHPLRMFCTFLWVV